MVTALVTIGSMGLLRQWRDPRVKHWGLLTLVTMVLFLGRSNLGEAYNLLPLHAQVNVMRYLAGVHICGIIAAAAAIYCGAVYVSERWKTWSLSTLTLTGVTFVIFTVVDARSTLKGFDVDTPHFSELVTKLKSEPGHRFAVHRDLGTGSHFHRDLLPALTQRGQLQSYAHGYHCTLSTFYAEYFDFSPAACRLFNVDTIVSRGSLPSDFPADAYSRSWTNGVYTTFHLDGGEDMGLFSFVDVVGAITGPSLKSIREAVKVLSVPAFASGVLPVVSASHVHDNVTVTGADGIERPWSSRQAMSLLQTLTANQTSDTGRGEVLSRTRGLASYSATVRVPESDSSWLLLKVNVFPWWRAKLNGEPVSITHVAPNFMAVRVPSGHHEITFEYINPAFQKYLALVSLSLIVVWGFVGFRRRLRSGAESEAS